MMDMGDNVVKSLSALDASKPGVESRLTDMKTKWSEIQALITDRRLKLGKAMAIKRIGDRLETLDGTLQSFQTWLDNAAEVDVGVEGDDGGGGGSGDAAAKVTQQLDQCKIKLKSLKSHEEKVTALFADAGAALSAEQVLLIGH